MATTVWTVILRVIYFADDNLGSIFVMGFTGVLPMECVVMKENSKMKISQTVYVTGFARRNLVRAIINI